MEFSDTLIRLRREKGWSQEELANRLEVSRQAVGKWEAGQNMPDLPKLIALCDLFGVSLDALVRPETAAQERSLETAAVDINVGGKTVQVRAGATIHLSPQYEYKSRRTFFGLPLVHVKLGYGPGVAKGILAIGNCAVGVLAIGGLAFGLLSFGGVALGLLLALGGLAVGGVAFGGGAVGLIAIGGCAIGLYAMGGCAIARDVAAGGYASGALSLGANLDASFIWGDGATRQAAMEFLRTQRPDLWPPLLWLLTLGG